MRKIFVAIAIILFGLAGAGSQQAVQAAYNPLNQACRNASDSGVCQQANNQGSNNPLVGTDGVITKAIKILGWAVGVVSVIMVIIGGLGLITSAGNPEKIATAKKRLIYALVGLAITALAWTIVTFVTNRIL